MGVFSILFHLLCPQNHPVAEIFPQFLLFIGISLDLFPVSPVFVFAANLL